jgi:hypothetical protein
MLRKSFQVLLLVAASAVTVSAQIDQARGTPHEDFIRYFNETVKYAEQKDRDSALQASDELRKALGKINGYSVDVPGRLNDGNLRDLGSQAQEFLEAIKNFRERLQSLQDKLKRTGEDYSSELSNLKSSNDTFKEKFNKIWGGLLDAGKALKAACGSGCIP